MDRTPPLVGIVMVLLAASGAGAQPGIERLVGPDESGMPIVLRRVDGRTLAAFARAARVPTGLELAPAEGEPQRKPVTLTGLSIGQALGVIGAFDQRYEMREIGGVFVLRPREAWRSPNHPLHAAVPPIVLPDVRARNALSLIAAFLGAPQYRGSPMGDSKPFSLRLQAGTVFDLLNGTVRAHGEMAWSFETSGHAETSLFPYTVMLYSGASGYGCGVPGTAPQGPVDVALYADPVLLSVNGSPAVLDRIVGTWPNGRALVVNGPYPSAIRYLAMATKVPMGIEFLGAANPPLMASIPATGRTLREVLDAMIAVDPRYEWREMEGVIAVRPTAAWNDPESLLFRLVPAVRLVDVSPPEAIQRLARELGYSRPLGFPQGKPMSVDQPQGSVLDLINAMIREHGELTWELMSWTDRDATRAGYRYTLTFGVMGGLAVGFPVR